MKKEDTTDASSDSSKCKALSIKERVEAANYAMEVTGTNPEDDEDVSDIIGEVYGG